MTIPACTVPAIQGIKKMIARYGDLCCEMDRLYDLRGDAACHEPEYFAASREAMDLVDRIVATVATSPAERIAKMRFIVKTDYVSKDQGCDTGELHRLVAMILKLDGEAVAKSPLRAAV